MSSIFETQINIKPLSVNQAWQGRRYKTEAYKRYIKNTLIILPKTKFNFHGMIRLDIIFGFSSVFSDLDNPLKLIIDILQKKYSFNDNQIYELNVRKRIVKKGFEFVSICFRNIK